jgi:MFS family permease
MAAVYPAAPSITPVRRLLLLTCTIVFLDTAFFAAITPLLPSYRDEFGLSKAAAGVLAAAYPAGTLVGSLPGGWYAARFGVRRAVLLGLVLLAGASVVFAFARSIVVLDAARFVQGVGGAATWAGALGWITATAPRERRGEVIGTAMGAAIAGALFGPVLGAATHRLGPEVVFIAIGVAALGLLAVAVRMPGLVPRRDASLRSLLAALSEPRVAAATWIIALVGLLFGVIGVLGPLRLDDLGAGATLIAATFLAGAALEAVVSPVMGRVTDRRGTLMPALAGVAAAGLVMMLLPWPGTAWLLIVALLVAAPAIGVLWAPAMTMLSEGVERRGLELALGYALMNLAWAAGETGGAAGGARLAQATADRVPYLVLAAACAGTVAVLWRAAGRRAQPVRV